MTNIEQLFSFLPYGKYAFYIWTSYAICILVMGYTLARSLRMRTTLIKQLKDNLKRIFPE
ncbi:MAG: heme exporter protein CcmD [Arenicellales bacterium]|jgi:heme exporter protein CcmD|nr:heme exporter protein CcmD [Arenicellales bacterium]